MYYDPHEDFTMWTGDDVASIQHPQLGQQPNLGVATSISKVTTHLMVQHVMGDQK